MLSEYGVKFDDSDWHYIKGCTEKQIYDLVYSKFNPDIPREELMSKCRDFLKKTFTKKLEYMDGFCDIHPDLKKKYKLALVTSTGMELVSHIEGLLSIYWKHVLRKHYVNFKEFHYSIDFLKEILCNYLTKSIMILIPQRKSYVIP